MRHGYEPQNVEVFGASETQTCSFCEGLLNTLAKLNFKYYGFVTRYALCGDYETFFCSFPIRFFFKAEYTYIIDDSVEFR